MDTVDCNRGDKEKLYRFLGEYHSFSNVTRREVTLCDLLDVKTQDLTNELTNVPCTWEIPAPKLQLIIL